MKLFAISILLSALPLLFVPVCRGEDSVEWKENWDATYTFNRDRWEKEAKSNPRRDRRANLEFPTRMVLLLESLLKKYPDDATHKIAAYGELADQLVKMEARGRACEYHKKIIDESRGKPDVALAELQNILKIYPRYYETAEARQWQEYAGRRFMALYRVGIISGTNPALNEAMECLLAVRSAQGRFLEAAQILDALKVQNRSDDRIKYQEAELYFKLGQIEKALECFQEISYQKQERQVPQRIALLSSHRWSSTVQQQNSFAPDLDKKWQNLLEGHVEDNLGTVDGLIQDDAEGKSVVSSGAQFASVWSAVDAQLRANAVGIETLREMHQDDAAALLAATHKTGRVDDLMQVFRKYPWTGFASLALVQYGERQLMAGHVELAARAFRDVLSHSISKITLAPAQTGLRLALEQDKRAADPGSARVTPRPLKKSAFSLPAVFPWPREMIEDIPAEIRPYLSWPGIEITAWQGKTLLSGPNLLVCFGDDLAKPLWVNAPIFTRGLQGTRDVQASAFFLAPAPVRPNFGDGAAFMRWGLDATHCYPSHVAAFDMGSGAMLWSTERDSAWQKNSPIGDPVFSDGKVFVMAIENGSSRSASALAISLICLDAKTGATLWQRPLANHQLTTLPRIGEREWDSELKTGSRYADMFHYGNAVSLEGGAVYCVTNCGVVARVDARDGVIEWLVSYPRTTPNADPIGYLRREGWAPLIRGNCAIFLPRDNEGVFALNKETGEIIWENPFAPSHAAIGVTDDALLVADRENVAALDPATGRARWFRSFDREISCRPICDGASILVASGAKMQRILAATGSSVEETLLDSGQTPAQLALQGDTLLVASLQNLHPFPYSQISITPAAIKPGGKLELPLAQAWQLRRPNPELIVPPQSTGVSGRVIVSSDGLLECLDMATSGKVVWRRFIAPGLPEFTWNKDTLLLLYARHIDARDSASGELKWRCAIPFSAERWLIGERYFFFSETERTPQFGAIDLESGKFLWSKRIDSFYTQRVPMAFDGKRLHLFGLRIGEELGVQLLDARDGTALGTRVLLSRREQQLRGMWITGTRGFLLSENLTLHTINLQDDKTVVRFHADLREAMRRADPRADSNRMFNWESHFKSDSESSRWMNVEHVAGRAQKATHFIFDRNDPEYMYRRGADCTIRGDRLFDTSGGALTVVDLPTKTEAARYVIPSTGAVDAHVRVVDFWQTNGVMFVVSGIENAGSANDVRPGALRIDSFDATTCAHRGGQALSSVSYWNVSLRTAGSEERAPTVRKWRETQTFAFGSTLLLTDAEGVHAFMPGAKNVEGPHPIHFAYRHALPIIADGWLQEWTGVPVIEPDNADRGGGQLQVTHDAEHLYIAASCNRAQFRPRLETQEFSAGDWLEIGIGTGLGNFRGCVALDARGQCFWEDAAGADKLSGEIQAGIRGDLAHGTHTYELAIPLRALVESDNPDWRRIGLSAALWEQTTLGPRKVAEWGGGLAGPRMLSGAHRQIYLDSATPVEEQAAWAVVHRYPELKASKDFIRKISATRGSSGAQASAFLEEILKAHAHDASVEALLEAFDFTIRSDGGDVLKIAEAAGVDASVRARFASRASAYLSQWVYLDPARPPRMIMLQLNDGTSWEHRISWGEFEWALLGTPGTSSRRLGGALPAPGGWQELRVPLLSLDLQNKPICGISFGQQGGGRVCWDRTAIVVDGKETAIIDGSMPDGTKDGNWEWSDELKRSGARAHFNRMPLSADEALAHGISALAKPIVVHLDKTDAAPSKNNTAELIALLESEIPKMGNSLEAVSFFQELLALEHNDAEKVSQRLTWFLNKLPYHPGNSEILGQLLQHFKELKRAPPEDDVEAAIKACKIPPQTAYAYRRTFVFRQHAFVRNWQWLGPFFDPYENGFDAALPPEGRPVDIASHPQSGDAVLNWSVLKSERDYVDLTAAMKAGERAVAFAACWVQCDKARSAMLEIGADNACKVWVNQKLVFSQQNSRGAKAGEHRARIFLTAGVNEILIKTANGADGWGFFCELADPEGRGPLTGIKVSETPP